MMVERLTKRPMRDDSNKSIYEPCSSNSATMFQMKSTTKPTSDSSSEYRPIKKVAINSNRMGKLDTKAIYCLFIILCFTISSLALPQQPPVERHGNAVATAANIDRNLRKVNLLQKSTTSAPRIQTVTVDNDDLQRQSTSLINQHPLNSMRNSTITKNNAISTTTTTTSGVTELVTTITSSDDGLIDDSLDNTTLLIDYTNQSYMSSSEAPPATGGGGGGELSPIEPIVSGITTIEPLTSIEDIDNNNNSTSGVNKRTTREVDEVEVTKIINMNQNEDQSTEIMHSRPANLSASSRDMRDARIGDKVSLNTTEIFATLFKKKPYSKYWSVEQKWDDIFKRFMAIQGTVKSMMMKNFLRDVEYYADISISKKCADDLQFIQNYTSKSKNMRWLAHMFDSTGKAESGMLTGNLANLGHVVQCIKVRAPALISNDSFDERYFEQQTAKLGERFRGKFCLASLRPVMPEKPHLVSRFSEIFNAQLMSNISYMGLPITELKQRAAETSIPSSVYDSIDKLHYRLDQIPFESELFEYLKMARNFGYSLPRFMGVCYPSSCTRGDIRYSIQKSVDDQHQVVDIEFECEVEESSAWDWFSTPRLVIYLLLALVGVVSFGASLTRHILVDRLQLKLRLANSTSASGTKSRGEGEEKLANLLAILDLLSIDKCAGILFIKTKPASPIIDKDKVENNRSTSIDALKGFLVLILIYCELVHLGCLPIPFMWSKWGDAMFPFFRSYVTQIFLNTGIWSEAFYIISAYLISLKLLENHRPSCKDENNTRHRQFTPRFSQFVMKRYIRLLLPMIAFIMITYVWPRLSNGFVMQDQAQKILSPCDDYGWTNLLMFHNYHSLNETCLWPTHVSASFFQLHLISYPILLVLLLSLRCNIQSSSASRQRDINQSIAGTKELKAKLLAAIGLGATLLLALIGLIYPALRASDQELIVPFLIDYIDFDNYRRVIEWTVLPTHNHLTSYMFGILLAYFVVSKRQQVEQIANKSSSSSSTTKRTDGAWHSTSDGVYMNRESSLESVVSSSTATQELNMKPAFMFSKHPSSSATTSSSPASSPASSSSSSKMHQSRGGGGGGKTSIIRDLIYQLCLELVLILVVLISLTASYFWNGLGQPMSSQQTFWYMIGTKLCFNLAFACIFYRHFATRKNSSNPWMITRFLVPIGRMSLMLFYVSWPVIWFDLLASLYQWHPSHYFVFEKYNEVMFMTLIVGMLAYGAFEGTIKIIQYQDRSARIKRHLSKIDAGGGQLQKSKKTTDMGMAVDGFESLFQPDDWDEQQQTDKTRLLADSSSGNNQAGGKSANLDNHMFSKGSPATILDPSGGRHGGITGLGVPSGADKTKAAYSPSGPIGAGRKRLSIADQYKLNAELRANYSFASIGLYESAGATDDLHSTNQQLSSPPPSSSSSTAATPVSGDPQVSPGQTGKKSH